MDNELAQKILDSIRSSGTVDTKINNIVSQGENINHVLSLSSGSARLQTNVIKRFSLIISQPDELKRLNPFEIRCCLCHKVISYPCWYYTVKYAVNHFHYFVCFDSSSPDKPNTSCYKRKV